ncbi:hypothetical protein ACHAW5_009546, partial [Stephanodiscus triporus]
IAVDSVVRCAHSADAVPVVFVATVDYSAANEYVRAHYDETNYFDYGGSSAVHRFYDGRALQSSYENEREMLNENGLAVIESPTTKELDWTNVDDVRCYYLPELERMLLRNLFPSSDILGYFFWNPIPRGGKWRPFDKNRLRLLSTGTSDIHQYTVEDAANAIIHGKKRFVIVNFWRIIEDEPVASAPLAVLSTRYDDEHRVSAFPNARPNMEKSRWYVFPNATKDEVIAFYQYDRNAIQLSDLWHCAITTLAGGGKASSTRPRRSFDIRALVVLDDGVPRELDRFGLDRTKPILTFEESGCFCDKQAEDRGSSKTK